MVIHSQLDGKGLVKVGMNFTGETWNINEYARIAYFCVSRGQSIISHAGLLYMYQGMSGTFCL